MALTYRFIKTQNANLFYAGLYTIIENTSIVISNFL